MELSVYYDDNYPNWWVSRKISKKITSFLKSKGFVEHNAEELEKWMEKSLEENKCHQSVVVFSQDIAPDTIYTWKSPSTIIRAFLDCGGRIVWMGDTPFFYKGLHPSRSKKFQKLSEEEVINSNLFKDPDGKFARTWGTDGVFSILGVMPAYVDFPDSKVRITKDGKLFKLQNSWYGLRPIIVKASDARKKNLRILATSKPLPPVSIKKIWHQKEKKESNIPFPSVFDFMSKLLGFLPTIIAIATALFTLSAGFPTMVTLLFLVAAVFCLVGYVAYWYFQSREILASAWIKNYNSQYPSSGFLRIFDRHLYRISDEMLEELYDAALAETEASDSSMKKLGKCK